MPPSENPPERPVPDWSELLHTARAASDAAAGVHARWLKRIDRADVRDKGHSDFVSKVDLEAQEAALEVIRAAHPQHPILAEETDDGSRSPDDGFRSPDDGSRSSDAGSRSSDPDSPPAEALSARSSDALAFRSPGSPFPVGPLWIVDPLDGTTNFLHGHPAYCASVGLVVDGRPEVGAITAVATDERWWAAPGEGAFRNGERIRVSRVKALRQSLIGTGFPFKRLDELPRYLEQFARVLPASSGIRRGGSAALDLCYLAQGSLDVFWEGRLESWDVAAGLAILAQAGGCWSRLDGRPLDVRVGGTILAANGPELRAALREVVGG